MFCHNMIHDKIILFKKQLLMMKILGMNLIKLKSMKKLSLGISLIKSECIKKLWIVTMM